MIPQFSLSVLDLSFGYKINSKEILHKITQTFFSKSVYAIVGPSGVGKSTFLRLLAGLITPITGDITLSHSEETKNIFNSEQSLCSFVPQGEALLPWRTVQENVRLPLELGMYVPFSSLTDSSINHKLEIALERFKLTEYKNHYPEELSGGLKKLTALARVWIENKPILLLDEPFSSIDVFSRNSLYEIIRSMAKDEGKLVIIVTHDFYDCERLHLDSVLFMKNASLLENIDVHSLFEQRDMLSIKNTH